MDGWSCGILRARVGWAGIFRLILSYVKGALVAGWALVPIGFILGVVSLFMKNKKKGTDIGAIIASAVGAIVAPNTFSSKSFLALQQVEPWSSKLFAKTVAAPSRRCLTY